MIHTFFLDTKISSTIAPAHDLGWRIGTLTDVTDFNSCQNNLARVHSKNACHIDSCDVPYLLQWAIVVAVLMM
jgi:hypothetical protein